MERSVLERNLTRYRTHQLLAGALFWMPTTILFLIDRFGLANALRMQAVYYAAVVLAEVPSGWMSDRIGRVLTLRLAAGFWIIAHSLFLWSPNLVAIGAAQICLAGGYAFLSGTDVTFHGDTLEALGRSEEFAQREALAKRGLLVVTAVTALVGGLSGLLDLRLPFAASLAFATVQLFVALRLVEPAATSSLQRSFRQDLRSTTRYFTQPAMTWIGLYVVGQVIVVHLAAELAPPYLAETLGDGITEPRSAVLASGVLAAAVAIVGALAVGRVPALADRFGAVASMVGLAVIPASLLGVMSLTTTVWLLPILALRGLQRAGSSVWYLPPSTALLHGSIVRPCCRSRAWPDGLATAPFC